MNETATETKFESDLKVFFPEIYKLHQMGKWDKWIWKAIYTMLDYADNNYFGEIRITYQKGRINLVEKTVKETSQELRRDGYAISNQEKAPEIDNSKTII